MTRGAREGRELHLVDHPRIHGVRRGDEAWLLPTECNYVTWYAPAVRNFLRDQRDAQYLDKSGYGAAVFRSQHALLELASLTAA